MANNARKVRLVVADLDGTLAKSKQPMDTEMADLLRRLLLYKDFAVISGGSYKQFQQQFVASLGEKSDRLSYLYLFPTCATSMYMMKKGVWERAYGERLDEESKRKIYGAFETALAEYGYKKPEKTYGEIIEDRETQITFSAFGQQAPIELKSVWDPDCKKRLEIIRHLQKYLPSGFDAKVGGTTSIDVTRKGIDKAYGIKKIKEKLGFSTDEMLFIGDKLEEGGNDYPVTTTGVRCMQVKDPEDTKKIIREIIAESESQQTH